MAAIAEGTPDSVNVQHIKSREGLREGISEKTKDRFGWREGRERARGRDGRKEERGVENMELSEADCSAGTDLALPSCRTAIYD